VVNVWLERTPFAKHQKNKTVQPSFTVSRYKMKYKVRFCRRNRPSAISFKAKIFYGNPISLYLICRVSKLDNRESLDIMSKEPEKENSEENDEQDEQE
jgi:hypothetical protein